MLRFGSASQIARRLNPSACQHIRFYCPTHRLELAEKKKKTEAPKKKAPSGVSAADAIAEKTSLSKIDIIASIAENHELTIAESRRIMATVMDTITGAVAENKSVTLIGLGSFRKTKTKSRTITVPSTRQKMVVPAGHRIQFRASKVWRQLLK